MSVYSARFRGKSTAVPAAAAYVLDRANGAGTLEVAGGHTLDAVQHILGGVTHLSATVATQRKLYTYAETGQPFTAASPDTVLLRLHLDSAAVASVHLHDGRVSGAHTRLEIAGTEGSLTLESHGPASGAGIQSADLRLLGARTGDSDMTGLPTPGQHRWVPGPTASPAILNVAQLYRRLAADIHNGTRHTPDFQDGLRLHELLDAIRLSAARDLNQTLSTW